MKRLMIVVTAAALGLVANAASCSWDADVVYESNGSGNAATGYQAFFFNVADLAQAAAITGVASADTIGSVLAKGTEADYLSDGGWLEGAEQGDFTNGQDASFYLVILDASNVANASYAYVSDVATEYAPGSGATFSYSFGDLVASASASNWTKIESVPEPTSGLLLLLGMAGLALKRKRT